MHAVPIDAIREQQNLRNLQDNLRSLQKQQVFFTTLPSLQPQALRNLNHGKTIIKVFSCDPDGLQWD